MPYRERHLTSARILRAAALYVEQHGYYIPLERVERILDADFGLDDNYPVNVNDWFDQCTSTPATPAASEEGAIAIVAFGWPNAAPFDGEAGYLEFTDALCELSLFYAPDGDGYGDWICPADLANTFRAVAKTCEVEADYPPPYEWTE